MHDIGPIPGMGTVKIVTIDEPISRHYRCQGRYPATQDLACKTNRCRNNPGIPNPRGRRLSRPTRSCRSRNRHYCRQPCHRSYTGLKSRRYRSPRLRKLHREGCPGITAPRPGQARYSSRLLNKRRSTAVGIQGSRRGHRTYRQWI